MPNANRSNPEKAVMLQKYMALHSRRASIRSSRSSTRYSPPTSPKSIAISTSSPEMSASESSSTSSSPTLNSSSFSAISPPAFALPKPVTMRKSSSRSSTTTILSPISEDAPSDITRETAPYADKLYDVNQDIKSTLTDLLNCEAVRKDNKMRLWVQMRLMEAEMEMKRQRKRRVSTPTIVLSPSEEEGKQVGF